jgi:hypothetical protein
MPNEGRSSPWSLGTRISMYPPDIARIAVMLSVEVPRAQVALRKDEKDSRVGLKSGRDVPKPGSTTAITSPAAMGSFV